MFSSNTIKFFFALVFAFSFAACGWWQTKSETPATPAPFAAEELKSAIPFQTKEPENYQADLIVITGGVENRIFTARRGGDYRVDFNSGDNLRISAVKNADGKSFLILNAGKIYAETSFDKTTTARDSNDATELLTGEWLNRRADARFTNLGAENGLIKYRVNLDDSQNAETIVFVDENINLPVRQEFYSIRGDRRTLAYTVETRNFKLIADAELFEIPANYKRVSLDNLRAVINAESVGQ